MVDSKVWNGVVNWVLWLAELSTQVNIWAFGTCTDWVAEELQFVRAVRVLIKFLVLNLLIEFVLLLVGFGLLVALMMRLVSVFRLVH